MKILVHQGHQHQSNCFEFCVELKDFQLHDPHHQNCYLFQLTLLKNLRHLKATHQQSFLLTPG